MCEFRTADSIAMLVIASSHQVLGVTKSGCWYGCKKKQVQKAGAAAGASTKSGCWCECKKRVLNMMLLIVDAPPYHRVCEINACVPCESVMWCWVNVMQCYVDCIDKWACVLGWGLSQGKSLTVVASYRKNCAYLLCISCALVHFQ